MAAKLPIPSLTFAPLGTGGLAVAGGRLYTYVAGGTTPQNTFTDETGASANTNPVILDSTGNANVWLTPGASYRFDLYDSSGVLLRTVDNVPGGTLAGQSSVTANTVFAGPTSGGAAAPAFRALVAADIPDVSGSYAKTDLSNLGTTNINAALLAQTNVDLGSAAKAFRNLFLWGSGTYGSTSIELTGTPTGARTLTLPNATDTLVGKATTDTLTNKTFDTAGTGNSLSIAGVAVTANTGTGAMVRTTSPTIVTPTIASFVNATHNHQNAAGGGTLAQAAMQPILPIFAQTATVTVANSASELTLVGGGQGSITLPAGFFVVGKSIKIRLSGFHSSTGSPTITIRIKVGGATIATASGTSGNGSNDGFSAEMQITCRSTGLTGSIFGQGSYQELHAGGLVQGLNMTGPATVDTTGTLAVDITAQWGTAALGDTMTATNFTLENAL